MMGPVSHKNWLIFAGELVPDTDSTSLYNFPRHCAMIVDLLAFLTQSQTDVHDTRRSD